jgi:hypothetical protein
MLAYMGKDHGLRLRSNQIDCQHCILAWFAHYLKGEPAEPWFTNGQSFLERDAELKRSPAKEQRRARGIHHKANREYLEDLEEYTTFCFEVFAVPAIDHGCAADLRSDRMVP